MYLLPENVILTAPLWLGVLASLAQIRGARLILAASAVVVALAIALMIGLEYDCGAAQWIGFGTCRSLPNGLVRAIEAPVILGAVACFFVVPVAVFLALISEIIGRTRLRRAAKTSPTTDKGLDQT